MFLIVNNVKFYKFSALGSATPNDLWTAVQIELPDSPHVSVSSVNIPHINISQIMDAWTKKMHYPILNIKRDYHNGIHMTISVENNITDQDNWYIFVTITTETELNFFNTLHGHWLQFTPQSYPYLEISLPHKEDGWIIANLQQMGKY